MYLLLGSLQQDWHGRQDVRVRQYQTNPPVLAEEAEPAHPDQAFRGLDLFVVLYVVGMILVTYLSFRAGASTLTTSSMPKTSTHNNKYASYLFTIP